MSSRTLCYNTCSISKPMIRIGSIEQLLNCSFMILWSRTHLLRRHTDPLLQRQLDFPIDFNNLLPSKKERGKYSDSASTSCFTLSSGHFKFKYINICCTLCCCGNIIQVAAVKRKEKIKKGKRAVVTPIIYLHTKATAG